MSLNWLSNVRRHHKGNEEVIWDERRQKLVRPKFAALYEVALAGPIFEDQKLQANYEPGWVP